jgi:hypothetical protein
MILLFGMASAGHTGSDIPTNCFLGGLLCWVISYLACLVDKVS